MDANHEQVLIVDNTDQFAEPKEVSFISPLHNITQEDQPAEEVKDEPPAAKGGKGKPDPAAEGEDEKEPEPDFYISDFQILKNNAYKYDRNEIRQTMKSADELAHELQVEHSKDF